MYVRSMIRRSVRVGHTSQSWMAGERMAMGDHYRMEVSPSFIGDQRLEEVTLEFSEVKFTVLVSVDAHEQSLKRSDSDGCELCDQISAANTINALVEQGVETV